MSYPEAFSLIQKHNYLYSHKPPSLILLIVFTPLSIRRGDGGEAVDGLVEGCRRVGGEAVFPSLLTDTEVLKDIPQHLIRSNLSTRDIG